MGLRSRISPKPSNRNSLKTTLKYVAVGGALATALFLVIYYGKKKEVPEREPRIVDLDGFKWQKVLVADHTKVKGNKVLLNFPLLVHLEEPDLRSRTQNGMVEDNRGYDIVFVDEFGQLMDHQVEVYDPNSGELLVWIRLQELSPFADTRINMYYGNENISEDFSTHFTWDNDYTGIWHLNDNIEDATASGNSGNSIGTEQVAGIVGAGRRFKGLKDVKGSLVHINDHESLDLQKEGTIEAWIHINSFQDWAGIIYKGDKPDFSDDAYFIQFLGGSERQRLTFGITGENGVYSYERSAIDLDVDTWYYVVFTWNQEKIQLYVNGFDYGSKVNNTIARNTTGGLNIGSQLNEAVNSNPFDGIIDEVRLSKVARSQQWVVTSYQNQLNPTGFFSANEPQPRFGLVPEDSLEAPAFSSNLPVGEPAQRQIRN